MRYFKEVMLGTLLMFAVPVSANILVEHSFREKWENSDVVVLGTVINTDSGGRRHGGPTATVKIVTVLKGKPQSQISLETHSRIPEENPNCCKRGGTYLMFLDRSADGRTFASVNGRFGLVQVGSATRKPQIQVRPYPS